MFSIMRHVTAKMFSNNTVPSGSIFLIEFFLDVTCYFTFDGVFFHGFFGAVHDRFLHFVFHVDTFDFNFGLFNHRHLVNNIVTANKKGTDYNGTDNKTSRHLNSNLLCLDKTLQENFM